MGLDTLIVGNAAGLAPTYNDVDRLCLSAVTRVTTGPVTLLPREGNGGQTYAFNQRLRASANSRGLPSLGVEKLTYVLPAMLARCTQAGKELRVSLAGFDVNDWAQLVVLCGTLGIQNIELNFGCPNVWGESGRKPIPSYDPELALAILDTLIPIAKWHNELSIGVKISPVESDATLSNLADAIIASGIVSEVVGCNTIPDQDLLLEDGSHALAFTIEGDPTVRHVGGLAGAPLKARSLKIVELLHLWLPNDMRVIGCGGIFTGEDVQDYLEADAAGFECGTAYAEYGPKIFSEILQQLPQAQQV